MECMFSRRVFVGNRMIWYVSECICQRKQVGTTAGANVHGGHKVRKGGGWWDVFRFQIGKMGFWLFLIEAREHYQMLFTASKNIVPIPSYRAFKIAIYIQLHCIREL